MSAARRNDYYYYDLIDAYRDSDEAAPKAIVALWDALGEFLSDGDLVEAVASLIDKHESKAAGGRSG